MKISYNWLKDYVDIKLPPEKLAKLLTMFGLTVDSIENKDNDSILEIEVTSNRPDWLSYIGVAREVAAITGRKLKLPTIRHCEPPNGAKQSLKAGLLRRDSPSAQRQIVVRVDDKKLCPRYTARVIRNVKVKESPDWLKKKIESIGLRPVNNIVDITNFCLFETGEPMHAFDLDRLSGPSIIVRKASKDEKIRAIDGVERTLEGSVLIIADEKNPVAIAGVMGGLPTEVSAATKNILLEAAYFDPVSIRRTSRKLALASESSYRFERKVDIENIEYASDRAAGLICELAGGAAGEFIDIGKLKKEKAAITLRYERLNRIIGLDIQASKVKKILTSLGLKIMSSSKGGLKLEPPEFRYDLKDEIDLIEEVARVYGYDNIPETIPPIVETGARLPFGMVVDKKIRRTLASLGLSEIITYSLLGRKQLEQAGFPESNIIKIQNPLSNEQEVMRTTLIPGMLSSVRWNMNRKIKDLKLFELGNVYFKEGSFVEKKYLSICVTGEIYDGWAATAREASLFDLKGVAEKLLSELGVTDISVKEAESGAFLSGSCASVHIKGEAAGVFGEVDPKILNNFDIKDKVYAAELDCDKIAGHAKLEKYFREVPRYPSIVRDISIVVDADVLNAKITSAITETAGSILKNVQLVDRYRGGQIPVGKTGLTYRLEYSDSKKTLEDKDVSSVHSRIVRALESGLGAKLR